MSIGDHIQFISTGVRGLVVKFTQHGSIEFAHVLCGPDDDGAGGGEIRAFPRAVIEDRIWIL